MSGNLGDPIGQNIAHYVIERRIGGGAMASVYQATDQIFDRTIALKVLMPGADALTRQRFRQEARTVSILDHHNIVKTLQVGQTSSDGVAYIAMDMVQGKSLSTLLDEESTLAVGASCALLEPIARALAYAHSLGVVHRDVKPSNILLHRVDGTDERSVPIYLTDQPYDSKESLQADSFAPFLSDFGIARALDSPELTSAGRTIGTPAYMAPEQCAGSREIDGRADIYSLGTVLYRCLVGRPPFIGTTTQILHAHVYEPLMIPDDILSELPPSVIEALRRSLMKEPEYRYKDASEMADALATVSESYTGEFQAAVAAVPEQPVGDHDLTPTRTVTLMETVGEKVVEDSGSTSHILIPGPLPGPVPGREPVAKKPGTSTQTQINIPRSGSTTHQRVVRPLTPEKRGPNWIGLALGATVLLLLVFVGTAIFRNLRSVPTVTEPTISAPATVVGSVSTPVDGSSTNGTEPNNSGAGIVGTPVDDALEVDTPEVDTPVATATQAAATDEPEPATATRESTLANGTSAEAASTQAADDGTPAGTPTTPAGTATANDGASDNGSTAEAETPAPEGTEADGDSKADGTAIASNNAQGTAKPTNTSTDDADNGASEDSESTPTAAADGNDNDTDNDDNTDDAGTGEAVTPEATENSDDTENGAENSGDTENTAVSDSSRQELESWLEDADYFFATREWFSALDYLKLLERTDRDFEVDQVQEMLAEAYIGIGNDQLLKASDQGSLNSNQLESAVSYYRKATETDGATPRLPQLVESLEAFLRTDTAQAETAKTQLSDAFAAYAGTLISRNDNCGAMEQITASVRIKYDPERVALQKQISTKCPALANLLIPEVSLSDLSGRIIYSSGNNASGSSIWGVKARSNAKSVLILDDGRNPGIAPNGTIMAYRSDTPEGIRGVDVSDSLNLPQGNFTQFTYNPEDSLDSPPTWSPSNQRIIFASTVSSDRVPRIYWANNDPTGDYLLVSDGREPDWHPTDDLIVFKGADFTGNRPGLWLMSSYGGDRRALTENEGDTRPAWSANGNTVVFMSDRRDGNWEIYAVDVPTQAVRRLTNNSAQDGLPTVSPDGEMVAFMSNRDNGSWNIYVVPLRGGNVERLTSIEGNLSNWLEHSIQWVK